MSSYKDYKKRALQNPEVKAEYDALQPEYDIIQAMIDARVQQNMTQKDLSAKTGITQADILKSGYECLVVRPTEIEISRQKLS